MQAHAFKLKKYCLYSSADNAKDLPLSLNDVGDDGYICTSKISLLNN